MNTIEVKKLNKYYQTYEKNQGVVASLRALLKRERKEVRAVDNLSFSIGEGELVGFIGPNGAGKTTTLKCLSGIIKPTSGKVKILDFDPWEGSEQFKKQIGLVSGQTNPLFWDLPPLESFDLNAEIYGIERVKFRANLELLVSLLEVGEVIKKTTRQLSLGERMKCELVAALLHEPRVLFLDEPTIGLDVVAKKNILDFIKEYNRRFAATVVLTSHSMEDVQELCQRVMIIEKGKLAFDGKLDEINQIYGKGKRVVLVLGKYIDPKALDGYGEVVQFSYPQVTYAAPRNEIPSLVENLLKDLPVLDLTVEELPLETIIREIFRGGGR